MFLLLLFVLLNVSQHNDAALVGNLNQEISPRSFTECLLPAKPQQSLAESLLLRRPLLRQTSHSPEGNSCWEPFELCIISPLNNGSLSLIADTISSLILCISCIRALCCSCCSCSAACLSLKKIYHRPHLTHHSAPLHDIRWKNGGRWLTWHAIYGNTIYIQKMK